MEVKFVQGLLYFFVVPLCKRGMENAELNAQRLYLLCCTKYPGRRMLGRLQCIYCTFRRKINSIISREDDQTSHDPLLECLRQIYCPRVGSNPQTHNPISDCGPNTLAKS